MNYKYIYNERMKNLIYNERMKNLEKIKFKVVD